MDQTKTYTIVETITESFNVEVPAHLEGDELDEYLEVRKEFTDAPLVLEADALARISCLERELRRQLRALDPAPAARPARKPRPGITVRWSVRRPDGGLPFVFTYTAPAGTWLANAEHDAKAAIKRAGLIPWAHLGTQEPHA